jgi:gluconokinase
MVGRPPLVLTLDVGSSSVRSALFDGAARVLPATETKLAYEARVGADGAAEVDAERLVRLVERALDGTLRRAGRGTEVAAVGVSTFWHGLLGLDAGGRATIPVLLWSDTRSWRQAAALREQLASEAVRSRTGCPIHPSYWPAKLAWLREAEPGAWSRTRRWVSFADLLYLRLFGELGTSPSMASGTGLRLLEGGSDPQLIDRLGLRPDALPPEAAEMRGLGPAYRRRWPQLAGAVWLTAAGDGALANLGSGCWDPGRRALTLGTSGALRVLGDRPARLAGGLWCYLLEEGRYVVGGSLSNGGNLWSWLVRVLRLEERDLDRRLREPPPAELSLTFLPLLAGERSLGFAPRATGAIVGLTLATTAEEIARAGLAAVAVSFAAIDRALDETVPPARLLVASGGALHASRAWTQMIADAVGKPVALAREFEASSAGAAMWALRRLGVRRKLDVRLGRSVAPREGLRAAYTEMGRRQTTLYRTLIEGSSS